jgi:hypothetical protein
VIRLPIGVAIGYPLGRNAAVLPPGRAPGPLPKAKLDAFNQAFGHVDLSDPATLAGRVGDVVTVHGPVDTRRDENGQTALMLTGFAMVFPQTVELRCEPVQCVACPQIALGKANTLQSPQGKSCHTFPDMVSGDWSSGPPNGKTLRPPHVF